MKLRRVLISLTPLLLWAGAACASTSGFAQLDQSLTGFGNLMQNGVGYGVGITGAGVVGYHFIAGQDWGHTLPKAMCWGVAGAAVHNAAPLSAIFGGAAAALITVVNHPAAYAAIHAIGRLVS
jgi:hypothetical protein